MIIGSMVDWVDGGLDRWWIESMTGWVDGDWCVDGDVLVRVMRWIVGWVILSFTLHVLFASMSPSIP